MPVSVLIVTRDRRSSIEYVLRKLEHQFHNGDQLVLIDDGSQEDISNLAGIFKSKFDTTFIKHTLNTGCIAARNEGILSCKYSCIVQLDDDSWLVEGNALNICEGLILRNPNVGVFALPIYSHSKDSLERCGHINPRWKYSKDMSLESAFQGCGAVLRREAVIKAGLYPSYYKYGLEEVALSARLFRIGFETRFSLKPRVIHGHEQFEKSKLCYHPIDPSTSITTNELCLAKEMFPLLLRIPIFLFVFAKAIQSKLSFRMIKNNYICKKSFLLKDYRFPFIKALQYFFLRLFIFCRNHLVGIFD